MFCVRACAVSINLHCSVPRTPNLPSSAFCSVFVRLSNLPFEFYLLCVSNFQFDAYQTILCVSKCFKLKTTAVKSDFCIYNAFHFNF
jgi:hypothetical protein